MSVSDIANNATTAINHDLPSICDPKMRSSTLRRTAMEKNSNSEVLSKDGVNGVIDDKAAINESDLNHTIRRESVLEKSGNSSPLKKGLFASDMPQQCKKILLKPKKPSWQIVLSVLTKNCLLVLTLLWLGQTIWSRTDQTEVTIHSSFKNMDSKGSFSEVESTRMFEAQLNVVDKKLSNEIEIVKKELTKQLLVKHALLKQKLERLEITTDRLDSLVDELMYTDFVTREEFESLRDDFEMSEPLDICDKDVTLDEIRSVASSIASTIAEKQIEKHAADGLGMVDYALASGGGRVNRHSEPFVSGMIESWITAVKGWNAVHANAQKVLEPSFGEPGQCFPLQGDHGFIDIKLRSEIIPEAITLEHVSNSAAYDRSSAPKDCRVFGWHEKLEDPLTRAEKMLLMADFSYDLDKSNVQTFEVVPVGIINMVRFEFTSNHGSSDLTCIYRIRVHGHELDSNPVSYTRA